MKNAQLAKKIKGLRKLKGLSQETLSETSGLNLRTIQRIEAGETEPRGDTLQRLASALNVSPNDLVDWTEETDTGFLTFLNLSALSFIAFPLLGIIIPLALWVLKRDTIKDLRETGKKLLNFQISLCLLICLPYLLFVVIHVFDFRLPSFFDFGIQFSIGNFGGTEILIFIFIPFLYLVNSSFIVINSIRSYQGKDVFYKPAIPFLR